jgi:hypothetical protein
MGNIDMSEQFEPVGAQARWDETFSKLDRSCPPRRGDESGTDYLRRLAIIGKRYIPKSEQIYSVTFRRDTADPLPDKAVPKFAEQVRQCVERNIMRTDNMAPGEMRAVMITDASTGAKHRCWVGPDSFVKAMAQPCRLVIGGLFQKDVGRLQQGVNDRALRQGIPQHDARRAVFGGGAW